MGFHIPPPLTPPAAVAVTVLNGDQKRKLDSELNIVTQNCKVLGDMLSELTPGQESTDDWQLLQVGHRAKSQFEYMICVNY